MTPPKNEGVTTYAKEGTRKTSRPKGKEAPSTEEKSPRIKDNLKSNKLNFCNINGF